MNETIDVKREKLCWRKSRKAEQREEMGRRRARRQDGKAEGQEIQCSIDQITSSRPPSLVTAGGYGQLMFTVRSSRAECTTLFLQLGSSSWRGEERSVLKDGSVDDGPHKGDKATKL